MPKFARVVNNVMILSEIKVTDIQAQALKNFLLKSASPGTPNFNIRKLVINSCRITDKNQAMILEGLIPHRDHIKVIQI